MNSFLIRAAVAGIVLSIAGYIFGLSGLWAPSFLLLAPGIAFCHLVVGLPIAAPGTPIVKGTVVIFTIVAYTAFFYLLFAFAAGWGQRAGKAADLERSPEARTRVKNG